MADWKDVEELADLASNTPPERRENSTVKRAVLQDRAGVVSITSKQEARKAAAERAKKERAYASVISKAAHLLNPPQDPFEFSNQELERSLARAYESEAQLRERVKELEVENRDLRMRLHPIARHNQEPEGT